MKNIENNEVVKITRLKGLGTVIPGSVSKSCIVWIKVLMKSQAFGSLQTKTDCPIIPLKFNCN